MSPKPANTDSNNRLLGGSHELPGSIVDAQVQRLLEVVNEYQQQTCSALKQQADEHSRQIVHGAYAEARKRLRQDILESRRQIESALYAAKAKQHTFMMQQKHQADREFLNKAWELLMAQLSDRWGDLQNRTAWMKELVQVANNSLPADQWLIEHPVSLPKEEIEKVHSMILHEFGRSCQFQPDPALSAGIRIIADDAVVDGSISGLLADRVGIESVFLAFCRECIVHSHE